MIGALVCCFVSDKVGEISRLLLSSGVFVPWGMYAAVTVERILVDAVTSFAAVVKTIDAKAFVNVACVAVVDPFGFVSVVNIVVLTENVVVISIDAGNIALAVVTIVAVDRVTTDTALAFVQHNVFAVVGVIVPPIIVSANIDAVPIAVPTTIDIVLIDAIIAVSMFDDLAAIVDVMIADDVGWALVFDEVVVVVVISTVVAVVVPMLPFIVVVVVAAVLVGFNNVAAIVVVIVVPVDNAVVMILDDVVAALVEDVVAVAIRVVVRVDVDMFVLP